MIFFNDIGSRGAKLVRAVLTYILILAFLNVPQFARASSLKNALDAMFMSNATSASAYDSQTRGGFVGGSLVARTPISGIPNIVSFDPPRLNAGCGGIDLYGGSFSFINTQQIIAIFRAIVANAVGVLFKIAIDVINEKLGGIMDKFNAVMQALNLNFRNTCAIANQVVNSFLPEGSKSKATQDKSIIESISGSVQGFFSGIQDFFTNGKVTPKETSATNPTQSASGGKAKASDSKIGNITWRALSLNQDKIGARLGTSDKTTMQIILSLLGTEVLADAGAAAGKNVSQGTGVAGTASGATTDAPKAVQWPPTIASVRTLLEGVPSANTNHSASAPLASGALSESSQTRYLSIYSCNGTGEFDCDVLKTMNLPSTDFPGTHEYIMAKMIGVSGVYAKGNGSLLDKLLSCETDATSSANVCGFTSEQKAIIGFTSTPILSLLKRGQGKEDVTETIARTLVPLIAEDYTVRMMEAVVSIANEAYMDVELAMPAGVKQRLQLLTAELQQTKVNYLDRQARQNAVTQFVTQLMAEAPALWMSLPSSSVGVRR